MEHPCHQCGAAVEEGTAFCRQCNAPQIRVALAAPSAAGSLPEIMLHPAAGSTRLEWVHALPAAVLSGVISAALMMVPVAGLALGMFSGGALCVVFYRRRAPLTLLTSAMGARLGALSGVLAFAFFSILTAIQVLFFHSGNELRAALLESIRQTAARTTDPQAQPMLDYLRTPPGLELVMVLGFAVMFVIFLVLSSAGGAIATTFMRRNRRP